MRNRIIIAGLAIVLAACQSKTKQVENFITGTYADSARGEFAVAKDTLVITQTEGLHYLITRNTTYQAIREGKLLPKHHKTEQFNGLYDPQKLELDEITTGRVFRFDPDKHLLKVNRAVYQKLN
jgi:hypothetical protein